MEHTEYEYIGSGTISIEKEKGAVVVFEPVVYPEIPEFEIVERIACFVSAEQVYYELGSRFRDLTCAISSLLILSYLSMINKQFRRLSWQ